MICKSVGYNLVGLPVSVTDQDGLTTACDRDALGRIVKEKYANGTEVAYSYDQLGRLATVLDENGHEIKFGWDRFGLSTRLTAADQLTDMTRDANGLVTSVTASKDGKQDRVIRREYDEYDRVTKVDYGNGETETFGYDQWGRLSSHTRGKLKETYAYDHFGRLAQKDEISASSTPSTYTSFTYDAYGNRTSRTVRSSAGETTEERRSYDRYGRLVEITSFGTSVKYRYDLKGRIARQIVDGSPIDFAYTKYGQLAGKYLGGREKPDAAVEYEYSKSGQIVARTANGVRQAYEYDGRGQLLAVKEGDADVERYAYDKAGNMVKKTILVRGAGCLVPGAEERKYRTTTFTFDGANQLVSSTTDGVTTKYAYDAAGRLVKEGDKTYRYGYLDKVLSVTEGERTYSYDYHVDGQLARADYGGNGAGCLVSGAGVETFEWDGLALIRRGDERFVNEPHIGGGNPVASSKGTTYFNDILGTTLGAKKDAKYTAAALTAFGEDVSAPDTKHQTPSTFFTGKPEVAGLGHAFLFRNYRAGLAKWQTADPLGYPDGWNALAYCGNGVFDSVDFCGAWMTGNHADFFRNSIYYDGRRMKDKYLRLITNADMAVDDDQSATSTYKHAMKRMGQSDADANQLIEDFIQSKITKASEWTDGYISGLYDVETAASAIVTLLGVASHTYQDKLCPVHYENGSPHIWFDNWLIDWRHFPELFRYVTTGYVQSYKSWIEEKFHSVLKGNMDLINEIFE